MQVCGFRQQPLLVPAQGTLSLSDDLQISCRLVEHFRQYTTSPQRLADVRLQQGLITGKALVGILYLAWAFSGATRSGSGIARSKLP
jgi:hypothetical protein